VVKVWKWWNGLRLGNVFGVVGGSEKAECGIGFEMDYESYECFKETPHNLDTYHHPSVSQILTPTIFKRRSIK